MLKQLFAGIKYNKMLPPIKLFNLFYPEFRVRDFLDFAKWYIPPLFFGSLLMIYFFRLSLIHLIGLIATPVLILCMLLVLYLHQGKEALKALNEAEMKLYLRLCHENDHLPQGSVIKIDLMREINFAYNHDNKDFLKDL